jgi:hypothetical protein
VNTAGLLHDRLDRMFGGERAEHAPTTRDGNVGTVARNDRMIEVRRRAVPFFFDNVQFCEIGPPSRQNLSYSPRLKLSMARAPERALRGCFSDAILKCPN